MTYESGGTEVGSVHEQFVKDHPGWEQGWVLGAADPPARWNVGTYWRLLSTAATTSGRTSTFEEFFPSGVVAPPHVHDDEEEEAFFVLEGELTFLLGDQEVEAPPGTYVNIAPGTLHGFRCDSPVGRVLNTLAPGGFDHGVGNGTPAPQVRLPPPGASALEAWREIAPTRTPPPWEGSDDPKWQVRVIDGRRPA